MNIKLLNNDKIIRYIVDGIISEHLGGNFDSIEISSMNEYPRIGIGLWELDEADNLLNQLKNGFYFIDLPYQMINLNKLRRVLLEGKSAQIRFLTEQVTAYINELQPLFVDEYMLIYTGIWSIFIPYDIYHFIKTHINEINNLEQLHNLFLNQEQIINNITVLKKKDKFLLRNRAIKIFNYVSQIKKGADN